jgi:hypothetical protein
MFNLLNEVMSSSSSASWGAEQFNLQNLSVLRFTICRFERDTNWHSCTSYEFDIETIKTLIKTSDEFLSAEGNSWFESYKKDLLDYFNYEPEYTLENQFDPKQLSPFDPILIVKKMLLISLFNKETWKSKGIIEALKRNSETISNSAHLTFSTFLNQNDFFVSILKENTYESLKRVDKFGIVSEDIFSNSEFMYSDKLDD